MSAPAVTVVDTGSGNLRSVAKALAHVGAAPTITDDPARIRRAERLVVPGQGAFGPFVAAMHERGIEDALREAIASGRPFLGICLGLQVLFEASEEEGGAAGLGVLPGQVRRFRPSQPSQKVPHMGWNQVQRPPESAHAADEPLLRGIADGAYFYFVHSYYAAPEDPAIESLRCSYGAPFTAAVRRDNLFACQFHPEKSQAAGLRLLHNFARAT